MQPDHCNHHQYHYRNRVKFKGDSTAHDDNLLAVLIAQVRSEISIPSHTQSIPLVAFEHLRLYIQKHLSQSVAVCDTTR